MPHCGLAEVRTPHSKGRRGLRVAATLANRVVQHARNNLYPRELCCPDCGFYPLKPITGNCGHTRCLHCVDTNGNCPCGCAPPEERNINVMVEELIKKMLICHSDSEPLQEIGTDFDDVASTSRSPGKSVLKILRNKVKTKSPLHVQFFHGKRFPVPIKMRYDWISELISAGRYKEAIPHIAILAAQMSTKSTTGTMHLKRVLSHLINIISGTKDPRILTIELYRAIRVECAMGSVRETDMECIICFNTLRMPITTPCGHTFCRACLRRIIDASRCCALCRQPLEPDFLKKTAETQFISTALVSTGRKESFSNYYPDYIPVFNCTVSYPSIPCHLLIFNSQNSWRVIKWILEFGSRKFGILFGNPDVHTIGTMVEVKDCVQLENGRFICSTIGISRFEVLDMIRIDGCNMAEVNDYVDLLPDSTVLILLLKQFSGRILRTTLDWLRTLGMETISDIIISYGRMPLIEDDWWNNPHGPKWLWWIIAVLPITDIRLKEVMLSTNDLFDRLRKVSHVLDKVMEKHAVREREIITYN